MAWTRGRSSGGAPEPAARVGGSPPFEPSWRKAAGIALILLLILVWAGLVAAMAGTVGRWPVLVQAPFYLFMGIAWIMPLKPLIRWMETGAWAGPRDAQTAGQSRSADLQSD